MKDASNSKQKCLPCALARKAFGLIYRSFSKLYLFAFARPSAQKFNNLILQLALRGRGYNNCCDPESTGEAIFIRMLAQNNPKLCIDVGANKGAYSKVLLETTKADVFAFEPLPKAFEQLKALEVIYPERFVCMNVGVGDKSATLDLFYGTEDSELASFSKDVNQIEYVGSHNVNKMSVPVITLDSFLEELGKKHNSIDLLKIDTEGFEYEVLVGAQKTISTLKPRFIQIEYNWHQLFRTQSLRSLANLIPDYDAYQMLPFGSGLVARDLNRPESNIYHYSNFVFIRKNS